MRGGLAWEQTKGGWGPILACDIWPGGVNDVGIYRDRVNLRETLTIDAVTACVQCLLGNYIINSSIALHWG